MSLRPLAVAATAAILIGLCASAVNAQAFIQIEANGQIITENETTFSGLPNADFTQINSYSLDLQNVINTSGGGTAAGRIKIAPLTFVKAITQSSILLRKALARGETINAELHIYATENSQPSLLYTVELVNALVTQVSPWYEGQTSDATFLESISLLPNAIIFTDELTNTQFELQAGSGI